MIVLEIKPKFRPPHSEFDVEVENCMVTLLLKRCVDEWVYHVDCVEEALKANYSQYLEVFKTIIVETRGLIGAVLTPHSGEFTESILSVTPSAGLKGVYAIYLTNTIPSKILQKLCRRGKRPIDALTNKLRREGFNIVRGYLHEGDLFAYR